MRPNSISALVDNFFCIQADIFLNIAAKWIFPFTIEFS